MILLPEALRADRPTITATVTSRTPLYVAPVDGLPGHVRAGSSLVADGDARWVVQDDTLSLVRLCGSERTVVPLPPHPSGARTFDDRQGNKKAKLDLEAGFVLGDEVIAVGSGSSSKRERWVRVKRQLPHAVELFDASALYAHLRATTAFSGSELNVEGAVVVGQALVLVQRGNGAAVEDQPPFDALGELDLAAVAAFLSGGPAPTLQTVRRLDLGSVEGVRLTPTDGAALPDGRLLLLCAAEDSPDAVSDGPVTGVALAILDGDALTWGLVCEAGGTPLTEKAEGISLDGPGRLTLVTDADDPDAPASQLTVAWSELR